MDEYAMYLRKSRYDRDFSENSLEETLHRHKTVLDAYAKKEGLHIAAVYKEVVSGESISQRPEMQRLLEDVGEGMYTGVLVMDIDRLSRGSSIDQGIISQTFKYSDTKIITPNKTYDPNNDFDEEYFEFSLFMSRKEYKLINKRLERGRKQSSKEGRFMGSIAPYGYERVKIKGDKGYTLKIIPEEAQNVRLMYDLYLNQGYGTAKIANRLNELGVPTRSGVPWSYTVVKTILDNCVNAGLIRVSHRIKIKRMVNGKLTVHQTYSHEYPIYEGLHEGIVTREEWEKVAKIREKNNRGNIPLNYDAPLKNYFAGRIFCQKCGGIISRVTSSREARMCCRNKDCDCVSVRFDEMEVLVRDAIEKWFSSYKRSLKTNMFSPESHPEFDGLLKSVQAKKNAANAQLSKCFDFLEQGVYTIDEFKKRKTLLDEQISAFDKQIANINSLISKDEQRREHLNSLIPTTEALLGNWDTLSAEDKNDLIKAILRRIEYYRSPNAFEKIVLEVFPNL